VGAEEVSFQKDNIFETNVDQPFLYRNDTEDWEETSQKCDSGT
jgi:hypothetical protein